MRTEDLDDLLPALAVHDVNPERAERTRERCVRQLRDRRRTHPESVAPWLEPAAALTATVLYVAEALQAATVLLRLQ